MKRKYLKLALAAVSLSLLSALAGAGYVAAKFRIEPTLQGDDYLVMGEKQAKECAEGGGCAIFSEREFMAAMAAVLQRRQSWKSDS